MLKRMLSLKERSFGFGKRVMALEALVDEKKAIEQHPGASIEECPLVDVSLVCPYHGFGLDSLLMSETFLE